MKATMTKPEARAALRRAEFSEKDYSCKHGHPGCSDSEGGGCAGEAYAVLADELEEIEASLELIRAARAILEFADHGTPVYPSSEVIFDLRQAVKRAMNP